MRSLTSYLFTIFAYAFFILRTVITLLICIGVEIPIQITNTNYEIIFLFITLFLLVLVTKRKTIGGILYFAVYTIYFGNEIYQFMTFQNIGEYGSILFAAVGIIIAFMNMCDLLLNKNRANMGSKKVKQTDWFYKDKKFDREMDERADKNNYRLM